MLYIVTFGQCDEAPEGTGSRSFEDKKERDEFIEEVAKSCLSWEMKIVRCYWRLEVPFNGKQETSYFFLASDLAKFIRNLEEYRVTYIS